MGNALRLLIAASTDEAAQGIVEALRAGGYDPVHRRVGAPLPLGHALATLRWDLCVSECVISPGFTAYDVASILQERRVDVPLILVSRRGDDKVAASAMRMGAHDHIMDEDLHRLPVIAERELRERPTRSMRMEAEHTARRAEELAARLAKVLDTSRDEIYFYDSASFQILQANEGARRNLGYSETKILSLSPLDLKPRFTRGAFGKLLEPLVAGAEDQISFETVHLRADGTAYPVEVRVQLLSSEAPPIFVEISHDITERKRAEAALRESEERFRELAENIHEVFWSATPDLGEFLYVSPGYERIWGRPPSEIYGNPRAWKDAIHEEDRDTVRKALGNVAKNDYLFDVEFRILRSDGEIRWVHDRGFPVRDADGNVVRLVGIAEDVTEDKRSEQEIRFQARLLDAVGQSVIATDLEGRITYWNRAAEQMYGWTREEAVGRNVMGGISVEASEEEAKRIMELLREGGSWAGEFPVSRKDGSVFTALVTDTPYVDERGELKGIIGTSIDITERKRQEQALRESVERFRLLSKATNDGVWDWNLVTNELWWNENFRLMFGYSTNGIDQGIEAWLARVHPDDRERVERGLRKIIEDGASFWTSEYRFIRADGNVAFILDRAYVTHDEEGRPIRMIGSMMDVTERKRAERELEESRRQLAASEKLSALGTLVSGVAHEVRTPLTYIANNAFLLQSRLENATRKDPRLAPLTHGALPFTKAILEGADRINHLVRNLRQTARVGPGRRIPVSLDKVVAEAVDLFQATHRGRVTVSPDLQPTGPIEIEKEQVQQVVLNLLVNAAEAMPKGGTIWVVTRPAEGGGEILVRDEGPGLPSDVQGRMFEPFYTTKMEGTGLGLSIAKRIVDTHAGKITYETREGEGTTFRISLPDGGSRPGPDG